MEPSPPLAAPSPPLPVAGRCFLALSPPPAARDALRRALDGWAPGPDLAARRVDPANWHLTLRFFGELDEATGGRLLGALAAQDWGAGGAVAIDHVGAFPEARRASVVWSGFDEPGRGLAARLAALAEAAAVQAGLPAERRPFRAHLTLWRLGRPGDLRPLLELAPAPRVGWIAQEVELMRSLLRPGGPAYARLAAWPLGLA